MNRSMDQVTVDRYVSIIGTSLQDAPVCCDGGSISAVTPPGCWGPMITPRVFGGHEVTQPVYVEGAEPGDSIAIVIEKLRVVSEYASSGTDHPNPGFFDGDPSVKAVCPYCHTANPDTYIKGIGEDAVRCSHCGNSILPQTYGNGYTVACSGSDGLAVAVAPEGAVEIAEKTSRGEIFLPEGARQHLCTILGRADFSGLPIRCHPMIGNIGCSPSHKMPASKNTGDFIGSLNRTDLFTVPPLDNLTDAHMDINLVGEGCVVLSPVLLSGGGIYFGDAHLTQGCGEIAGHTLDICAEITVRVSVMKGLKLEGPVLLPVVSELNSRFRPFTDEEYAVAGALYRRYHGSLLPRSYPIQVVGTGKGMDAALDNALQRTVHLTGLSMDEVKNRTTIGGGIHIGRTSGCVFLTILLEEKTLERAGLLPLVLNHYVG